MAATGLGVQGAPQHEERDIEPHDLSLDLPATGLTGEMWILLFECKGAPLHREFVELQLDRAYITFSNLCCLKDKFGYSVRDYLYYKKRCGRDVASVFLIDFEHQARAMIETSESERKARLIMAKEPLNERRVSITPIKRSRDAVRDEQPVEEDLDAYKVWLHELLQEDLDTEFKDDYRLDTIKSYKKWLTLQGELPDYRSNDDHSTPEVETNDNNQSRADWPSHARRRKDNRNGDSSGGQKKGVRGPLKGHSAAYKRIKSGSQKLPIQFSSRLGGPIGLNHRSFVDEVVMFTRKRAPLIGVRSWKDIKQNVKDSIASDMLNRWDLENTDNPKEKIWAIARTRYAGWRSALSATYKAHETNAARIKHKPVDVDCVEWHYLMKYFGSEKFKTISRKNSRCRSEQQIKHSGGSKPFSQHSYERRDRETGAEPNDIELWKITHMKNDQWSNNASQDVYENAVLNLCSRRVELQRDNLTHEEQNILFQSSYKEITGTKRTVVHGHGYMAKYPTRAALMDAQIEQARATATEQEKNKHLEAEVQRLRDELANEAAATDRKVEEARRQIQEEEDIKREKLRQQLKEDMAQMFAEQREASTQMTDPPSNIQNDDAARQSSVGQENGNNGKSQVPRNSLQRSNRNGTNFISPQQLTRIAKGRVTRSRTEQEDIV